MRVRTTHRMVFRAPQYRRIYTQLLSKAFVLKEQEYYTRESKDQRGRMLY